MRFLVDTNIISEVRKSDADPNVTGWFASLDREAILLSVLTVGEIRSGIERIRRRDRRASLALERWLSQLVLDYGDRILPVDQAIAEEWGRLTVPTTLPVIDGLLVATARVNGLTLATRNIKDIARTNVSVINPFDPASSK